MLPKETRRNCAIRGRVVCGEVSTLEVYPSTLKPLTFFNHVPDPVVTKLSSNFKTGWPE